MGPLDGYRVVELEGLGPAPFACMMLADMGADVVRVVRPAQSGVRPGLLNALGITDDPLGRGRRVVALDLQRPAGRDAVLHLVDRADALVEGFRPGVTERLGLGPADCLARNPRLVYGRMTGWGQDGPLAQVAGHDINYISLAGALAHFGRAGGPPVPPINLVGDFGGGGMLMAFGVVCALLEAQRSGRGQVIDAAMIDGATSLMAFVWGFFNHGLWREERGTNLLDTGAAFYDVYECADGNYVSIGPNERKFFEDLMGHLGLDASAYPRHLDPECWPRLRAELAPVFLTRTRAEWCELLEGTDVCFAPVLTMPEAFEHPHVRARETLVEIDGVRQPAPAPRFSRTPAAVTTKPEQGAAALAAWGVDPEAIETLLAAGGFPEG